MSQTKKTCCPGEDLQDNGHQGSIIQSIEPLSSGTSCCTSKENVPSWEAWGRPGYTMCPYVTGMHDTPAGPVPQVTTSLRVRDKIGSVRARFGISRNTYRVVPGLYSVGSPGKDAPVLVTSNYKLTFDSLRAELDGLDLWVLVLDTKGINVWCAAGKSTFSAEEVVHQVKKSRLKEIVSHRTLVLPLLGAAGVVARKVKKECGFAVTWGPIRARDIREFLAGGMQRNKQMLELTFSFVERAVLVPVEVLLILKPLGIFMVALFLLSGISPDIFSFGTALVRGIHAAGFIMVGVVAGAVCVPCFLPWIPGRSFAVKGILCGGVFAVLAAAVMPVVHLEGWAGALLAISVSSYTAMNFTGATPFTSPSGVEKEMRRYIPVQLVATVTGVVMWTAAPFFH